MGISIIRQGTNNASLHGYNELWPPTGPTQNLSLN
jgi:hypothetical protein